MQTIKTLNNLKKYYNIIDNIIDERRIFTLRVYQLSVNEQLIKIINLNNLKIQI